MKTLVLAIVMICFHYNVFAQRPDFAPQCKEAMSKLSYLVGDWKGSAKVIDQNGQSLIDQSEHITWEMEGLVVSIEGKGRKQDEIVFHALAMVNYDPFGKQYKFRSYVKEGFTTDAYFKILEDNKFEWGFDIPTGGKTKYTITLDSKEGTWYETGEYSKDGQTWMTFIEMNLKKV